MNKCTFVLERPHVGMIVPHRPLLSKPCATAFPVTCTKLTLQAAHSDWQCDRSGFLSARPSFPNGVAFQLHTGSHFVCIRCNMTQGKTQDFRNGSRQLIGI